MLSEHLQAIPEEWSATSKLFVALGDEQRQRLLLAFEPGERLNITQLVSTSKLSRTAVNHHLKVLRDAGVLSSEKIGKEVYFHIEKDRMVDALQRVLNYLKEKISRTGHQPVLHSQQQKTKGATC